MSGLTDEEKVLLDLTTMVGAPFEDVRTHARPGMDSQAIVQAYYDYGERPRKLPKSEVEAGTGTGEGASNLVRLAARLMHRGEPQESRSSAQSSRAAASSDPLRRPTTGGTGISTMPLLVPPTLDAAPADLHETTPTNRSLYHAFGQPGELEDLTSDEVLARNLAYADSNSLDTPANAAPRGEVTNEAPQIGAAGNSGAVLSSVANKEWLRTKLVSVQFCDAADADWYAKICSWVKNAQGLGGSPPGEITEFKAMILRIWAQYRQSSSPEPAGPAYESPPLLTPFQSPQSGSSVKKSTTRRGTSAYPEGSIYYLNEKCTIYDNTDSEDEVVPSGGSTPVYDVSQASTGRRQQQEAMLADAKARRAKEVKQQEELLASFNRARDEKNELEREQQAERNTTSPNLLPAARHVCFVV